MQAWNFRGAGLVFGAILMISAPASANSGHTKDAQKASHGPTHTLVQTSTHKTTAGKRGAISQIAFRTSKIQKSSTRYGGISCVPFARSDSGIDVKGNAANWWANASGLYERGFRPEPGSVLNFRATGRMHLGHVAVVSRVLSSREVEIDHANWWGPGAGRGGVSRGVPVMDVSENNDWSEVRVGLGHSGDFGSVYPTYGFIYDRPDHGVMVANVPSSKPVGAGIRHDEVAEAPAGAAGFIDAPDHSLR